MINGFNIYTDVRPVINNDRTLVPIRVIAEQMGAEVHWLEQERAVLIEKPGTRIRLVLNSTAATVNDVPQSLDVAPVIIGDRTMLPMRFVAEYLGAEVDWCPESFSVLITYQPEQ